MSRSSSVFKAAVLGGLLSLPTAALAVEEITWWTPNWGEERARKLAADFEAANPDIKLNLEITVSKDLQNRILVALRSGTPPDLIEASTQWVPAYADTGKLLALDDWAAANLPMDDLLPEAVKAGTYEGKLYHAPYRAQTLGMFYNKEMYREAGLDPESPPETWDELLEVSKTLTKTKADGTEQYGLGIAGGGEVANLISRMTPFIWMNGGDVVSEDLTTAVINSPEAVAAVDFYTRPLLVDKSAPPSTLQNDGAALRRLFVSGTIASYVSGQYDIPAIQKENPDLDFGVMLVPHPEGGETSGLLAGWSFVVPADSPKHEATLKFVAFMMQPENQGFFTDTFPAAQSAMSMERFQDPLLDPFKEMLKYARPAPATDAWITINQAMFDYTQAVMLGDSTPQEAMDEANEVIQEALDR
jgi:multiple sugar transport system substrate-binding protein